MIKLGVIAALSLWTAEILAARSSSVFNNHAEDECSSPKVVVLQPVLVMKARNPKDYVEVALTRFWHQQQAIRYQLEYPAGNIDRAALEDKECAIIRQIEVILQGEEDGVLPMPKLMGVEPEQEVSVMLARTVDKFLSSNINVL